jgi:hypothetical protein
MTCQRYVLATIGLRNVAVLRLTGLSVVKQHSRRPTRSRWVD